jgi:hypothetical protein
MSDALLVGNNLAVLVAAVELGTAGREVVLVTDGRAPGGHFRGLRVGETDFDIGMVLVDKAGPAEPGADPDFSTYRPQRRYDWTRFGALVDRWQQAQVDLIRAPTPEVLVDGRRWPDHLMANRLDILAASGLPAPRLLPREAPEHAAGKITSAAYDTLGYTAAAELNHGPEVQRRLVDPFADKVLGPARTSLLARYHRAGWLPLYWPETIAAACEGRPTGLPENPFWTTRSGFVGDLVRSLERRLEELPSVRVHGEAVDSLAPVDGGWAVRTRAGGRWAAARPVLGLGQERLRALVGLPAPERAAGVSVMVMCCLVRGSAMGTGVGALSVLDPKFATYRVTDQDLLAGQDPAWHRVVVEAGPAAVARAQAGEDVPAALVAELCRLLDIRGAEVAAGGESDDVRVLKTVMAPGAIVVPTATSLAGEAGARDEVVAACPSALLTGALLGFGVTSMNDQIVQGLAVADELR